MKIFLFILSLALSSKIYSQRPDTALIDVLGSMKEQAEQYGMEKQSGNKYLVRFVGYKVYWANDLSMYMQNNGWNMTDISGKNDYTFKFTPKIYSGTPETVVMKFKFDALDRITSVRISGSWNPVTMLFLKYWPTDVTWTSQEQLKKGIIASKQLWNEQITYNFKGVEPVISIVKK